MHEAIVPRQLDLESCSILFDASRIERPAMEFFDPGYWQRENAVVGSSGGRADACLFQYRQWIFVLRHYHRGGLISKFNRDRYWWTGLEESRPWREWRLLTELYGLGLPVPRPAAAGVQRYGPLYRADLVTEYLGDTRTLAELLQQAPIPAESWRRIGAVLREFHANGVFHADLNATNVLIDSGGGVFVVDFDKGYRGAIEPAVLRGNLDRLERSLNKFRGRGDPFYFDASAWSRLLDGYHGRD